MNVGKNIQPDDPNEADNTLYALPSRRRRLPFFPGVRTRIVVPFLLVILLVTGIAVYIVTRLVAGSLQERFTFQLSDSATAATNSLAAIEQEQLKWLNLMVFTDGVPNALLNQQLNDLSSALLPLATNAKADSVIVFDKAGNGLWAIDRAVSDTGVSSFDMVQAPLLNWPSIQNIIAGRKDAHGDKYTELVQLGSRHLIYISAPITTADGQIIGGIALGIQMATLAQRIEQQSVSKVSIFDRDGAMLTNTFLLALDQPLVINAEVIDAVLAGKAPVREITISNVVYQTLYIPLIMRGQPIAILGVSLPSSYIVEQSGNSRDIFGVLFTALFLFVGVVGVLTARSITRPILRLLATTRAIQSGDLSRRANLRIPDEIGELGTSFDRMTDVLINRNQEISTLYMQKVQQAAQSEAILSSISDAVIVQDMTGAVILRNGSADQLIGLIDGDVTLKNAFFELCASPENLFVARTVNFTDRFYNVLAAPVRSVEHETQGYVLIFRDVTQLFEAEKVKDELIQQVSHELRTPLTAVRGYIDLIKMVEKARLSDQGQKFLQNATIGLTALERMVNQVVDIGVIASGKFALNIEEFNLLPLLTELVAIWTPLARERELTLTLLTDITTIKMSGDRYRLGQAFDHVLRNACSYTLPGGHVQISLEPTDGCITVVISDSGVGIAADEIDKVFGRMYRGRAANAGPTDARGLGLGLFLGRLIIDAHRGTIYIHSEVNRGTEVTISLPISQTAHKEIG
jgi:two-component system sensor histidine kinase VicK